MDRGIFWSCPFGGVVCRGHHGGTSFLVPRQCGALFLGADSGVVDTGRVFGSSPSGGQTASSTAGFLVNGHVHVFVLFCEQIQQSAFTEAMRDLDEVPPREVS